MFALVCTHLFFEVYTRFCRKDNILCNNVHIYTFITNQEREKINPQRNIQKNFTLFLYIKTEDN
jgi:hypothetical protein